MYSSARAKSPSIQFSQSQITQYAVHLESGHPVGSSTTCNKTQVSKITKRSEIYIKTAKPKKGAAHAKKAVWKKSWNQRWRPRSGCGGLIMAKFLITITQINLWIGDTNLPELLLLKILPLSDPPLIHNFFMLLFLHGPHLFFTVWLFLCILDVTSNICTVIGFIFSNPVSLDPSMQI